MSTAPKGYPSTQKLDRVTADYASVVPVALNQNGLAVMASLYVFQVGTDAAEAGSTTGKVVAAGIESVARRGDLIRFTSGALSGVEVYVTGTETNAVLFGEDMTAAPAALDTFTILRRISPIATSGGGVSAALSFTLNGVSQAVTEDTTTPANNRPLPTKELGRLMANAPVRNPYGTTPVTTAAYVQLIASTTSTCNRIQIFDSSGETLVIATGGVGSEVDRFMVTPGGLDIPYSIPAGTRVSIKAVSANATVGEHVFQMLT